MATPIEINGEECLSIHQLAKELGVDRQTLSKLLHNVPPQEKRGRAHLYSIAMVKKVLEERAPTAGKKGGRKYELECKKLEVQIGNLEIDQKKRLSQLVDIEETIDFISEFISETDTILKKRLQNEYPKIVAGLPIKAIRVKGKQLHDEIREAQSAFIDKLIKKRKQAAKDKPAQPDE